MRRHNNETPKAQVRKPKASRRYCSTLLRGAGEGDEGERAFTDSAKVSSLSMLVEEDCVWRRTGSSAFGRRSITRAVGDKDRELNLNNDEGTFALGSKAVYWKTIRSPLPSIESHVLSIDFTYQRLFFRSQVAYRLTC